jgi:hypothetical protein
MMSPMLGMEALDVGLVARHQRGADELRKLHDRELFRVVAQRAGLVEHPRAVALGLLQQVRGVEILAVKRRVLAHQDGVEVLQGHGARPVVLEPAVRVAGQPDVAHMRRHHIGPRCHITSCGSQAATVWPRRCASRIMAKVVSL